MAYLLALLLLLFEDLGMTESLMHHPAPVDVQPDVDGPLAVDALVALGLVELLHATLARLARLASLVSTTSVPGMAGRAVCQV